MTPLSNQFIWQINEIEVPALVAKLHSVEPANSRPALPKAYEPAVKASGLAKAWNNYLIDAYSPDKNILVLPVTGEMSRGGGWYGYGNEFYIRQLKAAATDPDIKGVVLKFNTGGGTADSTPAFAQAVVEFKKVKPIVASVASCYSAGYYVASQCDEIFIENQAASGVGSIGTLIIYEGWAQYLKDQGIDMRIIRAKKSTDKARANWIEELSAEAEADLQASCDACQREFEGAVRRGRAGKIKSDEVFTAKTYNADQALALGLVDAKGDLIAATKRALQLAA
ncbi:S49 family peptidase [Dyadobacter crusticola]|uniref:S49 family peptidase n=1 Tax=Dyadobacter crusticola TaxID=292407 RepID=UPI0004E1C561|nr:S49 family peptidase [Dyadobacter crusticola]